MLLLNVREVDDPVEGLAMFVFAVVVAGNTILAVCDSCGPHQVKSMHIP